MFKKLFDLEADETVSDVQFSIQHNWSWAESIGIPGWVITLVLVAGLVAYSIYLYRSESWLSKNSRLVMGGSYLLAGLLLILILLEPTLDMVSTRPQQRQLLVLLDASQSMAIADQRQDPADLIEAAKVLGKVPLDQTNDPKNLGALQKELAGVTRLELAKAAITHPKIGIDAKLGQKYAIRYYTFGDRLEPVESPPSQGKPAEGEGGNPDGAGNGQKQKMLDEWSAAIEADANSSRIGSAIEEAIARHAGQPLAGVVVLSDFAWIEGTNPSKVARKMKSQGIPVYPMAFGLPSPPDLKLKRMIAPEVAFTGDKVPVRVQVESSGYDERSVQLTFQVDDETIETKELTLSGRTQFVEFLYVPERKAGNAKLTATIESLPGETTEINNAQNHKIRIIDEKINVLYVEGMPRWEYRYLRWVLLRDPRLRVRFLMTQGDKYLAATSPRHLGAFPSKAEDILKYDLVILGDVRSSYFSNEQINWLDELVKKGGGSLLMLAGPVGSPTTYADTKVAEMLPVKISGARWRGVPSMIHPVVTAEGLDSSVVSLTSSKELNNRIWSSVRPLGYLPQLAGPKPGATTLLSLPRDDTSSVAYPLVAWQRYGSGKTMFVGTADLWRLRREVGDQYHARFWGQAIQFLALSRILGQNKQITLETSRKNYATGERVELFANVLTEAFEPVEQPSYAVLIQLSGSGELPVELDLNQVSGTPGLYSGSILAAEEGRFTLTARGSDPSIANTVEFEVENVPVEQRETSMREEVAKQIAALSGGKRILLDPEGIQEDNATSHSLEGLASLLGADAAPKPLIIRREKALWDIPAIFVILILLTGVEWYLRRRENLV
ncbi:MAG: hypothetical protein VCA36_03515 [Opitutales bacterium]